ncbi:hypothetical protein [Streptococcus agalactiae]|uniref:AbrB family transcriptional regulator n=1 Tax=Streptococcus agalactiae MRI Z1-216 TaxID=1154879 RepID=A0AAD3A409_STRAG|nr:hypothetical protein [Streptococcus agalactiae]EPT38184.1 hypothetical protein SAG0024_03445 [Streptococcus agalactiae FSL C1-494]EPT49839.1 hypothetical protein SAG0034_10845 [Streptococcus agalactiae FSL S3-170]EPU36107.1 hypothetical protein SAG0161_09535 [Streptococcus agalactiae MRI Z1-213]EPU39128.1 hypothetical protein SAG0164_04495 [Streptococcus agalactiae MRI Z1-216]EPU39377.1 hypothetical protein SAG0162_10515 [Streptococcus agalactiae MRI Z1-214]
MELVKTIQIGDDIYLPIPDQFGIQEGQKFNLYQSNDGTLVLSPSDSKPSADDQSLSSDKQTTTVVEQATLDKFANSVLSCLLDAFKELAE